MTDSGHKRLCACGCGRNVTRPTELRHQQGKGPSILASAILEQNSTLIDGHRKRKSSRQLVRQQLVGRQVLGAASSGLAGASGHGVLDHFSDDDDYPMNDIDDAGPSGVHDDTPMQYSPPPIPNSPSHDMPETNDNIVSTLSSTRRSQRVAERMDRIGRQRWRANHVQFFTDEREDDPAEEEVVGDDLVAGGDEDIDGEEFWEDEDDVMAIAEPGQEGISVWDILGESFLQEVSKIGMF